MTSTNRPGVTLIELIITMTILAIISAVTVLAIRRFDPPNSRDPHQIVADSARAAMETGRAITMRLSVDSVFASVWIRPDGSVIGDSVLTTERFTGAPTNAR
jgi:prepilin-type N-terminal cleavage/methylation domain-containing protein